MRMYMGKSNYSVYILWLRPLTCYLAARYQITSSLPARHQTALVERASSPQCKPKNCTYDKRLSELHIRCYRSFLVIFSDLGKSNGRTKRMAPAIATC